MTYKRTQVYLEPDQHRSLIREAHDRGISLAELLREIVRGYFAEEPSREDFLRIVGLRRSGRTDIAREHDRYVAEAIIEDEDLC